MSIEYGLVFTFFSAQFDIPYSILFKITLSHFSKLKMIDGSLRHYLVFVDKFFLCQKTHKKKIFNSKVASHQIMSYIMPVVCV